MPTKTNNVRRPGGRSNARITRPLRLVGPGARTAWLLARIALVVAAIGMAVAWKWFGVTPLAVQSGSMEPNIPLHSMVFVHEVPAGDIRKGDVITFNPPGDTPRVTHRVVEREQRLGKWYFNTKGDANPVNDRWADKYRREQISAGVASRPYRQGITYGTNPAIRSIGAVPHLGHVVTLGAMPRVRLALILVPLTLILLRVLVLIWRRPSDVSPAPPGEASTA